MVFEYGHNTLISLTCSNNNHSNVTRTPTLEHRYDASGEPQTWVKYTTEGLKFRTSVICTLVLFQSYHACYHENNIKSHMFILQEKHSTPTLEHRCIQASAYVADKKTIFPTAPVVQQQVATDQSSKVDDGAAVDEAYYNADGGIAALPKQQIAWPSAVPVDDGSKVKSMILVPYQNNTPWLPQVYADPNGGW